MSASRFLDTNVIVYAYDTSDPVKQAKAQALLTSAIRQNDGAISTQVLGEFFHTVVIKRKLMTASEATVIITALKAGLQVAGISLNLVMDAIAIHQRYQLRYWDALIRMAPPSGEPVRLIRSRLGCRTQDLQHRLRAARLRPAADVGVGICNGHPPVFARRR